LNKLEEKAAELIALGQSYGLNPTTETVKDHTIYITYSRGLGSVITYTEKGKASAHNYEKTARKTETISAKNLPDFLKFYAARENKKAGA
jgi:hypothetical protein